MKRSYDVVIIGTGAGGGTLARRLAGTNRSVLLLERGDFVPRERENWDPRAVATEGRYRTRETWRDARGDAFAPYTHYCVGGNTKFYGGALLRLREQDFEEVRLAEGSSPAWPIRYADLEPYYTEAERLYHVHGQRGVDPTEPFASGPYPHAPIPHEPRIAQLFEDLRAHGWRPFPLPIAVRLPEEGEAPVRLGWFDGYPDPTESKADAHVIGVRPALASPNVTLLTRTFVRTLEADPSGRRVREIVAERDGEELRFSADVVVLAAGAINSAAILLRSGLANRSDQVGRNLMLHNNGAVIAISDTENDAVFQKTLGVTDFYLGTSEHPPLGAIQLMGKSDPDGLGSLLSEQLPGMTAAEASRRSIDFWLTCEDLPFPQNRVTVDADDGIRLTYTPNNRGAYTELRRRLVDALDHCGCSHGMHVHRDNVYVGYQLSISGVSHQNGTLRMGEHPESSVVRPDLGCHDLDNLYVCDASVFCSSGAVNPSLTIMALALRLGDHLEARLRG